MSQAIRKLELANSIGTLMYELTAAWDARMAAAVDRVKAKAGADLTVRQALALWQLHEPLKMSDLAIRLGCDQSNATGLVDRLERHGYLLRVADPQDRRVRRVELSEAGKRLRTQLSEALEAASPLESLDINDLETLLTLLERLRAVTFQSTST
jgi:DNA-binding MarR family transcriptional regulator